MTPIHSVWHRAIFQMTAGVISNDTKQWQEELKIRVKSTLSWESKVAGEASMSWFVWIVSVDYNIGLQGSAQCSLMYRDSAGLCVPVQRYIAWRLQHVDWVSDVPPNPPPPPPPPALLPAHATAASTIITRGNTNGIAREDKSYICGVTNIKSDLRGHQSLTPSEYRKWWNYQPTTDTAFPSNKHTHTDTDTDTHTHTHQLRFVMGVSAWRGAQTPDPSPMTFGWKSDLFWPSSRSGASNAGVRPRIELSMLSPLRVQTPLGLQTPPGLLAPDSALRSRLTLSLLRVINVKIPLQPHKKYDITKYGELDFS